MKNVYLSIPIDAILFDCDGTLSAIEGIDELARMNGVGETVAALTADAMGKTGLNLLLYQQRLALVKPTAEQMWQLAEKYYLHTIQDVERVIAIFKRLNKKVYLVSAGLFPAVAVFGERIGISRENIIAVNVFFSPEGDYVDFDHASPLVNREGKCVVVEEIKKKCSRLLFVGDGLNDVVAYDLVTRFVGFGGVYYRDNIAAFCEFYIMRMLELLPLALTEKESLLLTDEEKVWYQRGITK